jgi:hypothetical protein
MKKPAGLFLLLTSIIFLYGCPWHSPYAIDKEPRQYIDESLLGKWAAMVARPAYEGQSREEPVKIIFDKKSDMEYDVAITGYISELKPYRVVTDDTIKATAFISTVNNREFLNALVYGHFFIAEIVKENNNISILALSEQFTNKFVKSSDVLRTAIEVHYKTKARPGYDEWFVLKNLQKVN